MVFAFFYFQNFILFFIHFSQFNSSIIFQTKSVSSGPDNAVVPPIFVTNGHMSGTFEENPSQIPPKSAADHIQMACDGIKLAVEQLVASAKVQPATTPTTMGDDDGHEHSPSSHNGWEFGRQMGFKLGENQQAPIKS